MAEPTRGIRTFPTQQGEHQADDRRHPQGQGCRGQHGLPFLPSPELAGHDHRAAAQSHADELEEGVGLVGKGRRGDGHLPEGADHQVVQKVDADGDELLEDHRQHEQERLLVKVLVSEIEHWVLHGLPRDFSHCNTAPQK